jgi:hypothetical protein
MPRGVRNTPKPSPAYTAGPSPLIIIQPGPDGTQFNAYDLDLPQVVDELRRTLVHLVASQAGARVIAHSIPRQAAVVANGNGSHTRIVEETDL